jgi:iron complex transport system permease protein
MRSLATFAPRRLHAPVSVLIWLTVILLVLAIIAVNSGAMSLPFRTLISRPLDDGMWQIWLTIRLPRVLLAIVVGCALACSGAVMQ